MIDWSLCPDVERSADTLSGAWRIKGTRISRTRGATPKCCGKSEGFSRNDL